jgi:methylase of polypeptide subunit release factors
VIPLRFPPDATFAALRQLLSRHDFRAGPLCERTGAHSMYDFRTLGQGREKGLELETGLDALIRLFLDSEALSPEQVRTLLGEDASGILEACGLLVTPASRPGMQVGSVLLYPTDGLWIASDRVLPPDLEEGRSGLPEDVVYPAITSSVRVFMDLLPRTRCGRFLELCSGTGIAALAAASDFAEAAWAVDITERSTVFARFNGAMNGLSGRFTALQGDLWEPVRGQRFDRIAAHPPYVAAPRTEYVYRDGGDDGEWITRRVLQGARDHLDPGGILHCTCMLTERRGTTLPGRVREILGSASDDFDLLLVDCGRVSPANHFSDRMVRARGEGAAEVAEHLRRFEELKVESLVFTTLLLRLHGENRAPVTSMRTRGPVTRGAHLLWGLEVARRQDSEEFHRGLLRSRPRLSPMARMNLRYRAGQDVEDPWVPESARVEVPGPFLEGMDATLSVAQFLGRCDGRMELPALMVRMKEEGLLEPEITELEFARMVAGLVGLGVLEVEALPHPTSSTTAS